MLIKTLLNKIEKYSSFVHKRVYIGVQDLQECLVIEIAARRKSSGKCPICKKPCSTYDTARKSRFFAYIPIWGYPVYFSYKPRRVSCIRDGIRTEYLPWCDGKERITNTYKIFLGSWAKRLSWAEVALVYRTSWDTVFNSVKWLVEQGLKMRILDDIESIGIDELQVFKGHNYMTLVYQIDRRCKRLLWCGKDRTSKTLLKFFKFLGKEKTKLIKYICTDMWPAYLKVIKKKAPGAINILDRFHIMKKFNDAVDTIRREEYRLDYQSRIYLKNTRWIFLKREDNLTEDQFHKLKDLLKRELKSVKAYLLKKDFLRFWDYKYKKSAEKFLHKWCTRTNRTKLISMKKVSKMLIGKKELLLNWFDTNPRLSSGVVEGLNNKAKLTIKMAYGFKNEEYLQYALYHTLGKLPLPKFTHRFNC
jgi:transposase